MSGVHAKGGRAAFRCCGDIHRALPHSGTFLAALPAKEPYSSHFPVFHIHHSDPSIKLLLAMLPPHMNVHWCLSSTSGLSIQLSTNTSDKAEDADARVPATPVGDQMESQGPGFGLVQPLFLGLFEVVN